MLLSQARTGEDYEQPGIADIQLSFQRDSYFLSGNPFPQDKCANSLLMPTGTTYKPFLEINQKTKPLEESKGIKISLTLDNYNDTTETEIVGGVGLESNKEGIIDLSKIVEKLKSMGYPLQGTLIYIKQSMEWTLCFRDPIKDPYEVSCNSYGTFEIRATLPSINHNIKLIVKEKGRTKKTINQVFRLTRQWKNLCKGVRNYKGIAVQLSRAEAALFFGKNHKTIDEYVGILRDAKDKGLDFNKKGEEPFSKIRNIEKQGQDFLQS